MDQKKAITYIAVIVVCGLLAACCIVGGGVLYLYMNDQLPGQSQAAQQPTRPPEAHKNDRPSPIPPTRIPPTSLPPTAVPPTAVPTQGDTLVYAWKFDQAEGWNVSRTEGEYNVVDKKISGGKYDWQITARKPGNHQTYLSDFPETFIPTDDYQINVQGQRLGGAESAAYGIIFNYKDGDNFVAFLMNDLGNCLISQRANGQWQNLGGGVQSSSAIRSGERNTLTVKVSPNTIYAYINGELAIAAEDVNLGALGGTVGLSAELYNDGDTLHVQFDDYELIHPAVFEK